MLNVHYISTINSLGKDIAKFYDCFLNKKYTLDSFFCSFDQFHSTQYSFLISFCLIQLVLLYSHQISSNLRCNLVFMLTMINWSTEEIINANVDRHSLSMGYPKRVSTVHLNGI